MARNDLEIWKVWDKKERFTDEEMQSIYNKTKIWSKTASFFLLDEANKSLIYAV